MEAKNIDDVLVRAMSNEAVSPQVPVVEASSNNESQTVEPEVAEKELAPVPEPSSEPPAKQEQPLETAANQPETPADSPIDEYGNPVEKQKLYTEEEVQRLIHDRLSRGRRAEQPQPQQVQQIQQDFKADENSDEPWDVQLKRFVDQTIDERERKRTEQQWQQQQNAKQVDFESKFTTGMNKYSDFHQVVAGKPITDHMLLATRGLDNPAAFIYGACKLHPTELDRIARIEDPYAQASEVGRLHEKMIKERKLASNSPRPLDTPKGDIPQKVISPQPSIDERIHSYARQKRK
jgi:hypothetical protein